MTPIIRLIGVSRVFTTDTVETRALSDISIQVSQGEYLLIEGLSGCGKSTLLSIMGLLDVPTSGSYEFRGIRTENLSLTERARMRNKDLGFVFQAFHLVSDLTIIENVELPLRYRAGVDRQTRKTQAITLLERVGIAHRSNHYPAQLSGGQQQRAAIARSLIGSPTVLLADEPTGNLDEEAATEVLDLFSEFHNEGMTLCVVSHDLRYEDRADRSLVLVNGKLDTSANKKKAQRQDTEDPKRDRRP